MAFSFGAAAQPQQQQQTASPFGNAAAPATSSTNAFAGFGAAANAQPAQASTAGPSLFGAANNAQAGSSTGGLFGSTANKPASLFGSASTSTPATGSGLFGQQQQQPAAGGGLFGQQQQQPAQQGTSLFGQQQQQPAGGLFGQNAAGSSTGTGTGLFGSTGQQQPAGGGLFGQQQQQQPAAGGLFGSTQQQQQQPAAGGLFGSTNTAQPAGGLFGAKPAGSTFGQPQQQNSLFGSTAQPAGGLFNSTNQPQQNSLIGQSTTNLNASTAQPANQDDVGQRMKDVLVAFDPTTPECRFKTFFYNVVEPGTTHQYGRPQFANDDAKWARAERDNPNPKTMVPVIAVGWADVKRRVQAQEQTASVHQQRVKELNQALANLSRQTALSNSVRLASLQSHLNQLSQRLMHLAAVSPSFAPAINSAYRPEDGEMAAQLAGVKDSLEGRAARPAKGGHGLGGAPRAPSKGRMLGQINELWGALEEVRRLRRARGAEASGWAGDEKVLAEIALVLEQQQAAIGKLSELASEAVFDADVIKAGLSGVEGARK